MEYKHAALGGTFDHLHKGHEFIIDFALKHAEQVSIGITTAGMVKEKKLSEVIEHFKHRKEAVEKYIEAHDAADRVTLFELNDIFGTTLSDKSLDSIVVTEETKPNAIKINEERQKNGLAPLALLTCPFFIGVDDRVVNSTNIRRGITDRTGLPYASLFTSDILYLPKNLRSDLREPLTEPILGTDELTTARKAGQVAARLTQQSGGLTIAVGDIVSRSLEQAGCQADLQIIDFKSRRKHLQNNTPDEIMSFPNEPSTLNSSTVQKLHSIIQQCLTKHIHIKMIIEGEEDLLALPAILMSPLGSVVLYGQFDRGIILVEVTEEVKQQVTSLVSKFSSMPS